MPLDAPEPEDRGERSLVVTVAPVVAGRATRMLPLVLVVAVVVGVVAFLAGAQSGTGGASGLIEPTARPFPSVASPSSSPPVTATSPALRGPSDFAFAMAFRIDSLIAGIPDGTACVTKSGAVPGHGGAPAARSLVIVWLSSCPMPTSRRARFLERLGKAMEREIPNAMANTSRDDHGIMVTDFGYTQGVFAGTVTLASEATGRDLVLSITLDEPVLP